MTIFHDDGQNLIESTVLREMSKSSWTHMWDKQLGIRQDIMELITSDEADQVTPLMSKIYYRLLLAPSEWWDSSESLRVRGSTREEVSTTAWAELVNWLRVSPEDARRALQWLHEKQIIDYRERYNGREIELSFAGLIIPE